MSRKSKKGFTLVELLVVIVIIGILASLLLPAIVRALDNTKKTACGSNGPHAGARPWHCARCVGRMMPC